MNLFRKNKVLLVIIIISCGVMIMWGRTFIIKWSKAAPLLQKTLFGKKISEKEEEAEEVIPVTITKVARMDYKDTITSFGTIKGFGEIPIRFKESGAVSKFYFKEGDEIKKDELVVSQDQEAENLKLEYAKIEYNKNKTLYELGAITQDKLRQSELELESAGLEVKKRNFYAPSNGLMGTRKVNESELVEPNDIAATFLDINNVFCEVGIIERDIGKVKVEQKAGVTLDTFPNVTFEGVVDSVSPMIEGRSRTQTVRILIPNEKHIIKPGMFARAAITTFEQKDALVVPTKALNKTEDGYAVFSVIRNEQQQEKTAAGFEIAIAKIIPVKVGRATEDSALISEGISENQEIVLESPKAKESIKDSGRIEIIGVE